MTPTPTTMTEALDFANFAGPRLNKDWTPDDQDLIYTALNWLDGEGDADEDCGEQLVERLLAAWRASLAAAHHEPARDVLRHYLTLRASEAKPVAWMRAIPPVSTPHDVGEWEVDFVYGSEEPASSADQSWSPLFTYPPAPAPDDLRELREADEEDTQIAIEICDAVLQWIVKHDLGQQDDEFTAGDVTSILDGLWGDDEDQPGDPKAAEAVLRGLVDRARITRLESENARLRADLSWIANLGGGELRDLIYLDAKATIIDRLTDRARTAVSEPKP